MADYKALFYDLKLKAEEQRIPGARVGALVSDRYLSLFPDLQGKTCLDVGIGTGWLIESMIARGAEQVIGVDVSPERVRVVSERLASLGDGRVRFFCMDAESLNELSENQLSFINFRDVIEHLENPEKGLRELNRVLKDGGELLIQTPNAFVHETLKIPHRVLELLHSLFPEHVAMAETDVMLTDDLTRLGEEERKQLLESIPEGFHEHNKLFQPDEFVALLQQNGFSPVVMTGSPVLSDLMYQQEETMRYLVDFYLQSLRSGLFDWILGLLWKELREKGTLKQLEQLPVDYVLSGSITVLARKERSCPD